MWDKFYPFFKMNFDETAEIRFLPDLDAQNPLLFVIQNVYHILEINGKTRRVPCLKMYDKECPCCQKAQYYYNEVGDKSLGSKLYRKIDNFMQVLIINSPFDYPIDASDNPVRIVSIGPKLMQKIEASIMQGDFDVEPYDYDEGCNFRINKTKQGDYASYDTSTFARKSSSIPLNLRERISLYDLKTFRIPEMEASKIESLLDAMFNGKSAVDEMDQGSHGTQSVESVIQKTTETSGTIDPANKAAAILAKLKAQQNNN